MLKLTRHLISGNMILAERRSYYSSGLFTPEAHALRRIGRAPEPFPDRIALRTRATGLDPAALDAIRAVVGRAPIIVIVDAVDVTGEPGLNALVVSPLGARMNPPPGMTLGYGSDYIWVYAVVAAPAR